MTVKDGYVVGDAAGFKTTMGSLQIEDSVFENNRSINVNDAVDDQGLTGTEFKGGAFFSSSSGAPVSVVRSQFIRNEGNGAAFMSYGVTTIVDSIFSENIGADLNWDAIFGARSIIYSLGLIVSNTQFVDNGGNIESSYGLSFDGVTFADNEGEIRAYRTLGTTGKAATITDSIFRGNIGYAFDTNNDTAPLLFFDGTAPVDISSSTFELNTAINEDLVIARGPVTLSNVILIGNTVGADKGLLDSAGAYPNTLTHVTAVDNSSSRLSFNQSAATIINTVIAGNSNEEVVTSNGATVSLYNNFIDVSSLNALIAADSGNLFTTGSSLFVDKASGDYTPSSDLLIDRALPSLSGFTLPDTDINGADRSVGCSPDIGAIEVQVSDAVCIDTDGDGVNDIADADDDNDGQPDSYETTYGLDPLDASDASSDLDGDGLTNVEEYNYQTNPLSTDTDDDGVNDNEEIEADQSCGCSPLYCYHKWRATGCTDFSLSGCRCLTYSYPIWDIQHN